jgi:hypothetical protein
MDRIDGEMNFHKFPFFVEVVGQLVVFVWGCAPGGRNFELNRFGNPEDGDSTFLRNARPLICHSSHKPNIPPSADERKLKKSSSLKIKKGKNVLGSKENESAFIMKGVGGAGED